MSKTISPEHLALMSAAMIARDNLRKIAIILGVDSGLGEQIIFEVNRLRMALKRP